MTGRCVNFNYQSTAHDQTPQAMVERTADLHKSQNYESIEDVDDGGLSGSIYTTAPSLHKTNTPLLTSREDVDIRIHQHSIDATVSSLHKLIAPHFPQFSALRPILLRALMQPLSMRLPIMVQFLGAHPLCRPAESSTLHARAVRADQRIASMGRRRRRIIVYAWR